MPDEQTTIEVPTKFKTLVDQIEQLTALDLSELVKILEKRFGVSAAAMPAAPAAAPGPSAGGGALDGEEKSEFTIELTSAGQSKIAVIKVVREITGKGLKEAKELVDGAPKPLKENVAKEEAEEIKKKLEEAGAQVTLK